MSAEVIARALAHSRPGYRVAHFREAALPIFQVSARLLLLERKDLTAIEEACLNAVTCGLNTLFEISAFLGLAEVVVRSTIAALSVREVVNVTGSADRGSVIALTAKGRMAQATASSIVPSERLVPVLYDPFLRRIIYRHRSQLCRPREVREAGLTQIPLGTRTRPEATDIPVQQLSALAARIPAISDSGTEILSVNRLEKREMLFTPAVLLFYLQQDGRDVQVSVVIDGEPSHEHERALHECGADKLLGTQLVVNTREQFDVATLSSEEARDVKRQAEIEDFAQIAHHGGEPNGATSASNQVAITKSEEDVRDDRATRRALEDLTFRILRCYEHPELLEQALTMARNRLLIVSPWVRGTVVNEEFVSKLTSRLKAGAAVSIGYGLEDDRKAPIDEWVKKRLEALAKTHPKFVLKYIGNTHRKVLVCDRRFAVTTSFNWLSFRGDPNQPARDESGMYIGAADKVDAIYDDSLKLIREGYRHPPDYTEVASSKAAMRRDPQRARKR